VELDLGLDARLEQVTVTRASPSGAWSTVES